MSLIESLRRAGRLDSRGAFTLDQRKARQKMARFQLTDPRRYILEVVEAAVALGAEVLHFDPGRDVEVRFGGTPLPVQALPVLEDFLLTVPQGPEEYALRALAMACSALGALKVGRIRIESPSGAWWERTAAGDTSGAGAFSQHRVLVEGAHARLRGPTPEEDLLRREARHAPIPLLLKGEDLRPAPSQAALGPERTEEWEGARFRAAVSGSVMVSTVTLVSHGVVIGHRQPELPLPLEVVVWHDGLGRNASHSDVVEDQRLQGLMEELSRLALRCAGDLAQALSQGGLGDLSERARLLLVQLLSTGKHRFSPPFEQAPLLRDQAGTPLSLAELQSQLQVLGMVPVSEQQPQVAAGDLRVAWLEGPAHRQLLVARFGRQVQDAREQVLRVLRRRGNVERWERSPRPAELPPGEWIVRRRLAGPRGEIGLSPQDSDVGSLVHVLYRGRLLESRSLRSDVSYVAVLDFDELDIDDEWSGARPGVAWDRVVERLEVAGLELYAELAGRPGPFTQAERAHLLLVLDSLARSGRRPAAPFSQVALFPEVRQGLLGLAALAEFPAVYLVEPTDPPFPEDLPAEAWPKAAFVRVDDATRTLLTGLLRDRAGSARSALEALQELAERFRHRRPPTLQDPERFAVVLDFQADQTRGQVGLGGESSGGCLELLRQGVFLGTRQVKVVGPAFHAVVENPGFSPLADFSGVHNDEVWSEALERVRSAEIAARPQLLEACRRPEVSPGVLAGARAILAAQPELVDRVGGAPLYPAVGGLVSIPRLREELETQGSILVARDAEAAAVPGRLVLLEGCLSQVRPLFPGARWEPARPHLAQQKARQGFLLEPIQDVRIAGACLETRALQSPLLGQVGLVEKGGGDVALFCQRRLLENVPGAVPEVIRAAVEDPAVRPDASFRKVVRDAAWKGLIRNLAVEVGRLAGDLVRRPPPPGTARALALLRLLTWDQLPEEDRQRLEEAPLLRALPDAELSLAQVRQRLGAAPALLVTSLRDGTPRDGRLVVVADGDLPRILRSILGRPTRDDTPALERDAQFRARMARAASLPRTLPRCLVEIALEGPDFFGRMGFPVVGGRGSLVALDRGTPLGRMDMPYHLSVAVVEGPFQPLQDGSLAPLSRDQRRQLHLHQVRLYRALARAHPGLAGRSRQRAGQALLAFAAEERSALGGRSEVSEVLDGLLALPLVEVAGGRRVSVEALVAEAQARGRLLFLPRRPLVNWLSGQDLLPILPPGSPELLFCERVLGSDRLEQLSRPRTGRQVVEAMRALDRARSATVGWLGGTLDRFGRWLNTPIALGGPAASQPEPATSAVPPDEALLRALRREFALVARGRVRKHAVGMFEGLDWGLRPLGPPAWYSEGHLFLNRAHGMVTWIRDHQSQDPAAVTLLLAHLVGLANQVSDRVHDPDEEEFLMELLRDLEASFPS